jgi:Gly-Xaa carboxypeptidase
MAARHSKTMPKSLRSAILDPRSTEKVIEYLNRDQSTRARIRTTTAVDVIHGGSKCQSRSLFPFSA